MPFWAQHGSGWGADPAAVLRRGQGRAEALHPGAERAATTPTWERWNHALSAGASGWPSTPRTRASTTVWEQAISTLEQITLRPWEHSASENLYTRKLHYGTRAHGRLLVLADGRLGRGLGRRWPTAIRAGSAGRLAHRHPGVPGAGPRRRQGVRLRAQSDRPAEEVAAPKVVVSAPVWRRWAAVPAGAPAPGSWAKADPDARGQPQPGLLDRVLDRRPGAGDRLQRAARWPRSCPTPTLRAARLRAAPHRLRPRHLPPPAST